VGCKGLLDGVPLLWLLLLLVQLLLVQPHHRPVVARCC
jgi:hypothetical protein